MPGISPYIHIGVVGAILIGFSLIFFHTDSTISHKPIEKDSFMQVGFCHENQVKSFRPAHTQFPS